MKLRRGQKFSISLCTKKFKEKDSTKKHQVDVHGLGKGLGSCRFLCEIS